MLQMLQGLDFERYEPRTYLVSEGDQFSAAKATEFESRCSFPTVRFCLQRRAMSNSSTGLRYFDYSPREEGPPTVQNGANNSFDLVVYMSKGGHS